MEFMVTRSNYWPDDDPECPGAVKKRLTDSDGNERTVHTIEVNTLSELMSLIDKVKRPIIVKSISEWGFDDIPELEIYDSYRE